jgi:aspartate aminotransferase
LSRELKEKGHDVIALSLGEPDFDTPEFIKNAAKQAIDNNFSHYTPVPGLADLRNAIVKKFKRDNNLKYQSNQIVCSTGAKQSIAQLLMVLLNKNDEVILPAPYWVSYYQMIELAEGQPKVIKTDIENNLKNLSSLDNVG